MSVLDPGEILGAERKGMARRPSGVAFAFQFSHGGHAVSLVPLACFTAHLSEVGPAAELELQDERAVGHLVHILALWMGDRGKQGYSCLGDEEPQGVLLTSTMQAPFAPQCPAPGGFLPGSSKMQLC